MQINPMKIVIGLAVIIFIMLALLLLLPPKKTAVNAPTVSDYKNLTYIIENQPVTLVNGYSSMPAAPGSSQKVITRYFGNDAFGDLNGDGLADVAFLLTQETGGTGLFYYLAGALKTSNGYAPLNTIFLGDRIAPGTNQINNMQLVVNYAERKPGEPMTTSPSVGVSKYFMLVDGKLAEQIPPAMYGTPASLEINKQIKFDDGLTVTLKKIDDSRCKPNVVCIWAGELAPAFEITGGNGGTLTKQIQLGNIKTKSLTVDGYMFELKDATETSATILVTRTGK